MRCKLSASIKRIVYFFYWSGETAVNSAEFLTTVESFLTSRRMYATKFGSECMNDGSFVFDLREGRSVTLKTQERVLAFIIHYKSAGEDKTAGETAATV